MEETKDLPNWQYLVGFFSLIIPLNIWNNFRNAHILLCTLTHYSQVPTFLCGESKTNCKTTIYPIWCVLNEANKLLGQETERRVIPRLLQRGPNCMENKHNEINVFYCKICMISPIKKYFFFQAASCMSFFFTLFMATVIFVSLFHFKLLLNCHNISRF